MKKFSTSIWVKEGNFSVYPIGAVEEAMAFLADRPIVERRPLYYVAADAVEAARAGYLTADEAKDALIEFLDDADALAEERVSAEAW